MPTLQRVLRGATALPGTTRLRSALNEREHAEQVAAAHAKKDEEELRRLAFQKRERAQNEYEQAEIRRTRALIRGARRLNVAAPAPPASVDDVSPQWVRSYRYADWYLSPSAAELIVSDIRDAKRARRQNWLPWIFGIGGVIGWLVGLVSVWRR